MAVGWMSMEKGAAGKQSATLEEGNKLTSSVMIAPSTLHDLRSHTPKLFILRMSSIKLNVGIKSKMDVP